MKLSDTLNSVRDERVRHILTPTRVVSHSEDAKNTVFLLKNHGGQATIWSDCGMTLPPGGYVILDYGNEIHGSARITSVINPKGRPTKLRIRFGESVSETCGTPNNDHAMHDTVIDAANMGTTEAGMTAFRFLRVDNVDDVPCTIREICAVFLFRDLEYLGNFECDDPVINAVWTAAARTVQLCMQEYLWDAPKRDRLIWMGDIHPEVCAIADIFGKVDVVERSLDLVRDETPLPRFMNNYMSYTVSWGLAHYNWYRAFGDLDYLRLQSSYLKHFIRVMEKLLVKDPDYYRNAGLVDWYHDDGVGLAGAFQAECVWALGCFAELFDALNDSAYARRCRSLAKKIAALDSKPGKARCVHVHRVLAGMEDARKANRRLFSVDPCGDITTFQGFYLLKARALAGDCAGALDVIRQYWGGMLSTGATTFWEHFDVKWLENATRIDEMPQPGKRDIHADCGAGCFRGLRNSFCHGWGAGPAPWLVENIAGIRKLTPGGSEIAVSPNLCGLKSVRCSVPTAHGVVEIRHKVQKNGRVKTDILQCPAEVKIHLEK